MRLRGQRCRIVESRLARSGEVRPLSGNVDAEHDSRHAEITRLLDECIELRGDRNREHAAGDIVRTTLVGKRDTQNSLGFRRHVFCKVEARKIEPRFPPFSHRSRGGKSDQLGLAGIERSIAIETPDLRIESECTKTDGDLLLAKRRR